MNKPTHTLTSLPRRSILVEVRQKRYSRSTEIYIPYTPYTKSEEGYEGKTKTRAVNEFGEPISANLTPEEDKLERSLRRSKIAIRELALCNDFELFATFTFGNDRFNNERTRIQFMNWLKRQAKQYKDFEYLAVGEYHKRCEFCVDNDIPICTHDDAIKAIHFHALIKGYEGKLIRAYNKSGSPKIRKGKPVYNLKNYTLGYTTVQKIGKSEKELLKAARYLTKYVSKEYASKDLPLFKNKNRYFCSRGLKRAEVTLNPDGWYLTKGPTNVQTCEHGVFYYFNNDDIGVAHDEIR